MSHPLRIVFVRRIEENRGAVDDEITEVEIVALSRALDSLFLHTVKLTVINMNVVNLICIVKTVDKHTILTLLAGDIAHINISHRGDVAALCLLVRLIREVDAHHSLTALADGNIADIDILGDTSTAGIGLDTEHAVEIRRVHLTVLSKDILHSTGDFGTYDDAAVAVLHLTVADDDVLAWYIPLQAVLVAAALDGYTIVASVESTVLDDNVVTALRVAAVAVRALIPYFYVLDEDILAKERVDNPERRVEQCDIFDGNILTLIEIDELRAHALVLHIALLDVKTGLRILKEQRTANLLAFLQRWCPAETFLSAPFPPGFIRSAAVDGTLTRYGNILLLVSVDAGAEIHAVHTLPARFHDGIELLIEDEEELGILLNLKVYMALEEDGTGIICSGGNNDLATAPLGALGDGFIDGFLVRSGGSLGRCSVLRNVVGLVDERRFLYILLYLLIECIVPSVIGKSEQWHGKQQEQNLLEVYNHSLFVCFR